MKFSLQEKVKLPSEIHKDLYGKILATFIGENGIQYKVRYFWAGDAKEIYFYENELEAVK